MPSDATGMFTHLGRIDGIGQGWWAPIEALRAARVDVAKHLFFGNSKVTHSAKVWWLPSAKRGQKMLPPTLRYVGLSRFPEDGPQWPDGSWSVELIFDEPPAEQGSSDVSNGKIRFLFEDAPQRRLSAGIRFGLYEGPHKVADVEVLD